MINIYNDLIFDSERYQKVLCRGKICHQTFLNSAGPELLALRSDGININYFPNPADSSVENINSYLSREKDYDLFFAASGKRDSKRFALIDKISELDQSLRVGVFGSNRNRILGDNYFQIIKRSEAALNWSKSNDIRYCSSNRMAQLFGAGVAVCQPKASRFQDFLSDDAAIWFDGAEDLQKKLTYTKQNKLFSKIAKEGKIQYMKLFNEKRITKYMIYKLINKYYNVEWMDY